MNKIVFALGVLCFADVCSDGGTRAQDLINKDGTMLDLVANLGQFDGEIYRKIFNSLTLHGFIPFDEIFQKIQSDFLKYDISKTYDIWMLRTHTI